MKYLKILVLIISIFLITGFFSSVVAANKNLAVTFHPVNPNFTTGQKSMLYVIFQTTSDTISAGKISLSTKNSVQIVDILSPVDMQNAPLSNTKIINKKINENSASATVLLIKNTKDLPASIKIPVIVQSKNGESGTIHIDTPATEVVDASGKKYTLSLPKDVTITFSATGQTNIPAPSPTPLPGNSMILNISTKLQGISADTIQKKTLAGFRLQLVQKTGTTTRVSLPQLIGFTMDPSGIWRGSLVVSDMNPGASYQLLIKGPKHLQKRICQNTPSEAEIGKYQCNTYGLNVTTGQNQLDFSGISLMAGDIGIQDGILNAYDLSVVQNAIRKSTNTSSSDADLNFDGEVTKKDYDIMIQTLSNTTGFDQK